MMEDPEKEKLLKAWCERQVREGRVAVCGDGWMLLSQHPLDPMPMGSIRIIHEED